MTTSVPVGATGTRTWTVDGTRTITRGPVEVFSTPNMVLLMEEAAMAALAPYITEAQETVGSTVDVAHVAATPVGMSVTAKATVTAVDRRRVSFEVEATDDVELIGRGTHERFIIDLEPFIGRLQKKSQK
ncbi:hotdog domain-containing protein [Mycobacterium sp. 236(2023)]|uniref:thioesterase family protein n=1 Tax=Mycobacterium sp. 236(2023) TaxID=3038163 RepID=UPI0024155D14|nr:hotdog domain-containing protein [Mycobacterium sp. 236(2023)]MDG4663805.1 hotdog domain-containing protein [Mycobacterium sp. 236(2023)]